MIATSTAMTVGLIWATVLAFPPAYVAIGNEDDVEGSSWTGHFVVHAHKTQDGETDRSSDPVASSPWDYRFAEWRCSNTGDTFCVAYACADPDQVGYLIERRLESRPDSAWRPYDEVCAAPDGPAITPGRILEEVRRVGLPSMSVQAPPETFVNYETVVYTNAAPFTRTVNLLGFTVEIEATPSQFRWNYGDGATETTTGAGRPYPATDITHTWTNAHRTFHPSVDVTYQIRYRIDDGSWQTLGDTITIEGPEGDVRIREATGMLADMR